MQLKRHVAYQSVGGALLTGNQSLRGQVQESSSGFMEPDTEIHRMVASLLRNYVFLKFAGTNPTDGVIRQV
jgi:hypothetical protein